MKTTTSLKQTLLLLIIFTLSAWNTTAWGAYNRTWTASVGVGVGSGKGTAKVEIYTKIVGVEISEKNTTTTGSKASISSSQSVRLKSSLINRCAKYSVYDIATGYHFDGWYSSSTCSGTATSTSSSWQANSYTTDNWDVTYYAKISPNTYTVKFNGNGSTGGSMSNQTFTYDAAQNLTANGFSKTGYTFAGWATSASGNVAYSDKQSVKNLAASGEVTLYAKWTPNTYKVKFNGNGSTSGSMSDQTFTYDAAQNLSAFTGFARAYTVSYNANGGTTAATTTANTTATYTFDHWNTQANNGGTTYGDKASVKNLATSGTFNLYAQWSSASVTLPMATQENYVIEGWYNGSTDVPANKVGVPGDSYTPTANVTLTAKWIARYPFTMSGSNRTMEVGDEIESAFTFTYAENPKAVISQVSISAIHSDNNKVIEYDADNNKLIALNAGTAKIYFTQDETETIKSGTSTEWTITVNKIDNTLKLTNESYSPYVDNGTIDNIIYDKNSDATVKTNSSADKVAYYNTSDDKIYVPNSEAESFATKTVTITISQDETYKYKDVSKTVTLTVMKYTPSFSGSAYNNMKVDGTQIADYKYTNTSAEKPTDNSSNDFYYTIDDVKFTNLEKNKGTDLVTFNPTDKKITACNAGTAKITLHQKETYKYSGAETSFEVAVSKYDNAFTCSWGSWTKKVNFDEVVPVEFTTNNNDYTNSPIEISQTSGKTIATLTKNDNTHYTITASYTRDDATWHLSQAENYKYKACEADAKVQVRVLSAVDCYMFEDNSEHSFSTKATDFSGHFDPAIAVSGPVKQIWFDAKKENLFAVSYFLVQYSVDNGVNWRTIAEDIALSTSYETYGPYNFPGLQDNERVSHIRFGAARGATFAKYYTNIKISRTTSIKPEDEDGNLVETLTMPQNTVGGSTTAKFYMNYSTCDDVVKIVSNDSHFTVNLPEISVDHSKDFNRAEITITYSSETRGTHTGTITIYTKYQNRTFTVTGTTDKKVQTLTWKNGFTDDPLTLPVGLTVDNKNIAVEASSEKSVMYESSNDKVIKITWGGLGFEVVGVGTATLKASEAGDDYWFPVSESKTVNVTDKKIQVIVWNQDLMSDLALNQVVDLDAKVYLRDMETGTLTYSEVRTPYITYSCPNNSVISVAGNKMTIKGYGETSVTAVVPEATGYEESLPVTLTVKVHEPSTGCATPNVLNHADNVQLFSMDMDLSNYNTPQITSAPILLNAANGKPDKLSYKHNGELYTVPGGIGSMAIKLCRGTVKAQQRVNGVWSDISGSAFDNGGKEGSKGAYDWRTVENLQLDENADAIRFVRLTDGQGYHNFKDIKISLLQYLRPTKEVVDLGDIEIGEARQAQIGFEYSDVKGEIKAAKTNVADETYTINEKTIYLTCGSHGHYDLPITVTPTTLGAWSTTITLTDNLTNVSTTLTVKAKVTEGIKYVFNGGEGEGGNVWGSDDNWAENQSNPGKNDAVLINSDVEITGDVKVGSMTIAEGVTVTVTVTGSLTLGSGNSKLLENFGDLHVADGGKVNVGTGTFIVRDFILDAALGNAQGKNASSGQLNDDEGNMYLSRDAYFQMSFDPSGQITYGWYDFTVPFEVNITDGIYREGDLEHPLVAGTDFIVMQHSEAARAAGKKDWSVFRGTMLPGRVYTITFDDEVTQNTFLFKKKQGAKVSGSADFQAQYTEGSTLTSGWNGLGNGTLHHTQLNNMPSGKKVQLYDHTNNVYVSREAGSLTYAVGTSFFMQVKGEQTITLSPATSGYGFLAPERTPRATEEFRLALAAEGSETVCDRMWVSANEDATGEYTIDHDLLKMGTPTEAKIAQLWGVRNNTNLCDIEMQMSDDKASCDLGLFAPQAKAYTLSVENGPKDATLYLTHNGEVIWDLSSAPYVFDLAKGTTEGYGLQIQVHNTPQVTTGIDETSASGKCARKVLIGNQLYIITPEGAMYSVTGTKIQ